MAHHVACHMYKQNIFSLFQIPRLVLFKKSIFLKEYHLIDNVLSKPIVSSDLLKSENQLELLTLYSMGH